MEKIYWNRKKYKKGLINISEDKNPQNINSKYKKDETQLSDRKSDILNTLNELQKNISDVDSESELVKIESIIDDLSKQLGFN